MDTLSPRAEIIADHRIILIRVKVERAKKHLVSLEQDLSAQSTTRRVIIENAQSGRFGDFKDVPLLPFDAIAAAGDVIQNLRSALDHLAGHLVLAAGNQPTKSTCFPISKNLSTYESEKARKVAGMTDEAKEAIDKLRPYRGGNRTLWKLHELNNIDKHRALFTVHEDILFTAPWIDHPFGDHFRNFLLRATEPNFAGVFDEGVEDDIHREITASPAVSAANESPLLPSLREMIDVVGAIVSGFRVFLDVNPPFTPLTAVAPETHPRE